MMSERFLPLEVWSPSSTRKMRRFWLEPDWQLAADFDLEDIRARLRQVREHAINNQDELIRGLEKAVESYQGARLVFAADVCAAADEIERICGTGRELFVNKSSTFKEIQGELAGRVFQIHESYYAEFTAAENTGRRHHWEIPAIPPEVIWRSFERTPVPLRRGMRESGGGQAWLLGVNALSTEDGYASFLQHFGNISRGLAQASHIVLLVGLEKLVASRADAQLQTRCAGLFGYEAVLHEFSAERGTKLKQPEEPRNYLSCEGTVGQHGPQITIILLDNGRRELLASEYRDLLLCINCRSCLKECPTLPYYGWEDDASPKDYLIRSLRRGEEPRWCTACTGCKVHCPLDIDLPLLMMRARSEYFRKGGSPLSSRLLHNTRSLSGIASFFGGFSNSLLDSDPVRGLLERTAGIKRERRFQRFTRETLVHRIRQRAAAAKPAGTGKIAYFAGCLPLFSQPQEGIAVIEVLEKNGFEVILPEQTCCGFPSLGNGFYEAARKEAENNVSSLAQCVEKGYRIVVSCPSCGYALRKLFPRLVEGEQSWSVAQNTVYFSELLLELFERKELNLQLKPYAATVSYHVPCHLKGQGLGEHSVRLLRLIPGLKVNEIGRGCCGLCGSFGFKEEYYRTSLEIGGPLFARVADDNPDLVSTDCDACKLQLEQGTGRQVIHPAILLRRAYE